MVTTDLWAYRRESVVGTDLTGFSVDAVDGGIGKIDEATSEDGGSYIIVDTGHWIFGKKVMLPAGVIKDIDFDAQSVFVERTKDQIKHAPKFDESCHDDESYRSELSAYFGPGGPGYSDGV